MPAPSTTTHARPTRSSDEAPAPPAPPAPPQLPARPPQPEPAEPDSPVEPASPPANPAAALAGVIAARAASRQASPPPQPARNLPYQEPQESDDEPIRSPALPTRPRPLSPPSPTYDEPSSPVVQTPRDDARTAGAFHMYNINEMVSIMGKRKKMPTTLGINLLTGTILVAPEHIQDGPSQEWTADRMTHYSREGKHVFMELVRPSKSVDFHAGAKDTAEEIVNALGELAGAVRAEGLREVIMAGSGKSKKKGQILYDFMAQGEDEVTVAIGDEVIILDDAKSEEWWQVRRLKNGKEGVVPSSYIELSGTITPPPGGFSAKSAVEQNRLEEIRLTKEAMRAGKEPQQVGPGMPLPERGSSLMARENGNNSGQQRSRRENGRGDGNGNGQPKSKSKPDSSKVRTWTDRSRSFSVDAQFLGLKDGKIHLHKMNGVKIAVPITKMCREDLEYVENFTGISLEDDKPLADVKRARSAEKKAPEQAGVTIEKSKKSDYDWFQFFLSCEVAVGLCERYAQAFIKDSMDESVLPDVDANTLRALGLREGDIIKVVRALDAKYGRNRGGKRSVSFASDQGADGEGAAGGLFSGPGGTLRNNTRKGRPAPAVQTSNVVDAKAFSKSEQSGTSDEDTKSPTPTSPGTTAPSSRQTATGGFDDDAWDVKPSKHQPPAESKPKPPSEPTSSAPPTAPALTGSMKELSLLTAPLEPTKTEPTPPAARPEAAAGAVGARRGSSATSARRYAVLLLGCVSVPATRSRRPRLAPGTAAAATYPPPRHYNTRSVQPSAFSPPPLMPQMTGSLQGQVAPPGQSLLEINQARLQQQYTAQMQQQQPLQPMQPMQPTMTGYPAQGMVPFPTGAPAQFMQPMMTGAPGQPQFAPIPGQPTGFQPSFPVTQSMYGQPAPGGVNSYLPPPLEPQRTGMPVLQPQATGLGGINGPMPPPTSATTADWPRASHPFRCDRRRQQAHSPGNRAQGQPVASNSAKSLWFLKKYGVLAMWW
ncbi:hypothetical protein G7Z17_g10419 [Cylindrodendrum hubeiense]|uniref:Actin cytoskeleton-regulatory complex protein SLA1 n=1 Tax=Cylindrodendrum hubeiense TaxID=595255 RepID=A0A9P5H774_9HYPO|nr:hypothetical protein G7Z17_g10419 [Cylindrodendrum hubeiense]